MGSEYGLEFKNLQRVLDYLMNYHGVGYASMDKKENTLYSDLSSLTSQGDFIEAVVRGDIDKCRTIIERKPKAIRSVDRKDRCQSAPHIAVE